MTIKFLSESERIRHPQASLIPQFLWANHFGEKLRDQDKALMKVPFTSLRDEVINDDNWYCVMLSQKEADDTSIIELAKLFSISTDIFVISAVAAGRIGLIKLILTSSSYELDQNFTSKEQWLLILAAVLNQPQIIELIYKQNSIEVISEILNENCALLKESSDDKAFESCCKLLELLEDKAEEVVNSRYYEEILKRSINFGEITLAKKLLTLSRNKPLKAIRPMIESLLSFACDNNQPGLIDFLIEFNSDSLFQEINKYYLKRIIEKGNLSILNKLITYAHDKVFEFITENKYELVKLSAKKGHSDIAERCFELLSNHDIDIATMISSKNYDLFANSIINGQVKFAQKIYDAMGDDAAKKMMAAKDYLSLAGQAGSLELIEWLLTKDPICLPEIDWLGKNRKWLWTEFNASPHSVEFGDIIKWLETCDQKPLRITREGFKFAFLLASEANNLGLLNKLMIYSRIVISHYFGICQGYEIDLFSSAFALAAKRGHINLMNIFIELDLVKAPDMIKHQEYEAFHFAMQTNQHGAVNRIIELLSENEIYDMLESRYHEAFSCNEKSDLSLISKLLEWLISYKSKELTLRPRDWLSDIFRKVSHSALQNKRLDIFKRMFEIFPEEVVRRNVIDDVKLFQLTVETGVVECVVMVLDVAGKDKAKKIIARKGPKAFHDASFHGYSDICNILLQAANNSPTLVAENNYQSFVYSIRNKQYALTDTLIKVIGEDIKDIIVHEAVGGALLNRNIPLCYKLLELVGDKIQKSIDEKTNFWLRFAGGYQPGIEFLLQFPSVFSRITRYGKGKHCGYPPLVLPRSRYIDFLNIYIEKTLKLFKEKKLEQDQLQLDNNSVDIANNHNSRICCYYIMRHLIRRNTSASLSDLHFLLTIPRLYHLIFALETPVKANKLLDLCLSTNNIQALVLLMCIPTVFDIVMQTMKYNQAAQSVLNLDQVLPPEKLMALPSLSNASSIVNPSSFFKYKSLSSSADMNFPDSFQLGMTS